MYLRSDYSKKKVFEILNEQVDRFPNLLRCLISLNAHRFIGTSRVCGIISDNRIELFNRKDPYLSLCAKLDLYEEEGGTIVEITWKTRRGLPSLVNSFIKRYKNDKATILDFLYEWLNAKEITI